MSVRDILKEWNVTNYRVIDKEAITEITLGASILATGGGGDPEIGLLWAYKVLDEGKEIIMVDPLDIPDDIFVASLACLGAPLVITEKPPRHDVMNLSLEKLQNYLGKKIQATIPAECGGINSPIAYAAAAEIGVPIIDVDGMNRAFPELQMTSWVAHGVHASPTVAVDDRHNVTIIDARENDALTENLTRKAAMAYGGSTWIATYPMTGKQVKEASVLGSQSVAWAVGRAVCGARRENLDPVDKLLESLKAERNVTGYRVFKGKIVDIRREFGGEINKGFSLGMVVMDGIDEYKGQIAELEFQNEWLRLKVDGKTLCLPPDLIAIVDSDTGEPIRTDVMKYGYRGSIVLVPAHERMRIPAGLELFGPNYFGYQEDYVPVEELTRDIRGM